MKFVDPHIHMYSRTTDDYEKMALAGIRTVIEPSFWLGQERTSSDTLKDYSKEAEWARYIAAWLLFR